MARSSGPDAISVLSLLSLRDVGAQQRAAAKPQALSAKPSPRPAKPPTAVNWKWNRILLGTRYMAAAGFDPRGTLAFLKTMDQERQLNPIDVPAYILSHPLTQERLANAELVVKSLAPKDRSYFLLPPLSRNRKITKT